MSLRGKDGRRSAAMAAGLLALWVWPAAAATSPQRVNFQGKLLDTSNNPQNGTFNLTFNLYNVASGGSALWSETQNNVSVTNGVFNVSLGAVNALTSDLFGSASAYLEVQVGANPAMTPRQLLLMAPVSFRALVADQLAPGNTSYIQVSQTLQSGAAFNVSSGTVGGPFQANGVSTFTASGPQTYSLVASSGLLVQNGTLNVQGSGGVVTPNAVQAATLSVTTGLLLPQGPVDATVGSLRWNATTNLVSIGTGTANKTLADTDSFQTLTNKTLNSTGNQVIDATKLQTRSIDGAAPADGASLRWDAARGLWSPIFASTVTVVPIPVTPANNITLTANTIYTFPLVVPGTLQLNQIRYRVTTGVGGVTGDVGLYDSGGALVAHGGASAADFTTAAAKSVNAIGAPVTIQAGQYYIALTCNGAPAVRGNTLGGTASAGVVKGLGTAVETGGTTLPAVISISGIVDGNNVMFMSVNN